MSRLKRLLILVVSVAMVALYGAVTAGTVAAQPPNAGAKNTVQLTGTGPNGEKFTGTFTATGAQADPNAPKGADILGTVTGQLTSGPGQPGGPPKPVPPTNAAMPVTDVQQATCQVLNLTLGPLDLSLLGLNVHLDQVHLVITATPGGGILGNLLCSLAGGPGVPGTLNQVIALLQQIIASL